MLVCDVSFQLGFLHISKDVTYDETMSQVQNIMFPPLECMERFGLWHTPKFFHRLNYKSKGE